MLWPMVNEQRPADDVTSPGEPGEGDTTGLHHPRPQFTRASWADLCGPWAFPVDDADRGTDQGWAQLGSGHADPADPFDRTIQVPFPPESPASGIGDPSIHPVVWYRRSVTAEDLAAAGHVPGNTALLHFGAVDHVADVWADGIHLTHHEGGHTPFTVELPTALVDDAPGPITVTVRAQDDADDLTQPRGKQEWRQAPHVIWYDRTTGIWQPVWLESVPTQHLAYLAWSPDLPRTCVDLDLELSRRPLPGTIVRVSLHGPAGELLADVSAAVTGRRERISLPLSTLRNRQELETYLWSPERPVLIDAEVTLVEPAAGGEDGDGRDGDGRGPVGPRTAASRDVVGSYLGLREVGTADGNFLLNRRPTKVHAVLNQGFWPQSHLAAPSGDALREEVQLILDLGFTTARVHQKIEDPRFLYWADRLGLMIWEEMPSSYDFTATSTARLLAEWQEAIRRDVSHPCIVTWVPFNESWGVQELVDGAPQRDLTRAGYHLTKSLDPTRPVISNDGWEHTRSDLLTIHDYENDPQRLLATYETPQNRARFAGSDAPADAMAPQRPAGHCRHGRGTGTNLGRPVRPQRVRRRQPAARGRRRLGVRTGAFR
jgi:beta-galactosidase/beta-glucuronidase